jgi:hypothetical protein
MNVREHTENISDEAVCAVRGRRGRRGLLTTITIWTAHLDASKQMLE